MTATVFVDTNVLIYAMDRADPVKQSAAESWRVALSRTQRGRASVQVLHEFYTKVVRKWPVAKNDARAEVVDLFAWRPLGMTTQLIELGWKLQDRFQLFFSDALIVAAAKTAVCTHLLTGDLQAGQDFEGLAGVSPFLMQPDSLL